MLDYLVCHFATSDTGEHPEGLSELWDRDENCRISYAPAKCTQPWISARPSMGENAILICEASEALFPYSLDVLSEWGFWKTIWTFSIDLYQRVPTQHLSPSFRLTFVFTSLSLTLGCAQRLEWRFSENDNMIPAEDSFRISARQICLTHLCSNILLKAGWCRNQIGCWYFIRSSSRMCVLK